MPAEFKDGENNYENEDEISAIIFVRDQLFYSPVNINIPSSFVQIAERAEVQ